MKTILDTIIGELEQPPSSLICAGKDTTSSCFTLDRVKCYKTEDILGDDECRLKIFVEGDLKKTLKKNMHDGQLWKVGLDFPFDQKVVVELWDDDSPPFDPHDLIGKFKLSKETMDKSKDFTAKKTFKSGRAHYDITYNVKHSRSQKKGPGPLDEHNTCGVPRRSMLDEIVLEGEIEDFEKAKKKTSRASVRPRLSFFQNVSGSSERNHFQCGALRQAKRIGAIRSPVAGTCQKRIGATPYDSGAGIISAIEAASSCFNDRPVEVVHIFSHGFPDGIPGTTGGSAGLYRNSYGRVERTSGGRTVLNIPTAQLSDNVAFVLHGCNMASGDQNIARSLYEHLATRLSKPRVYGHYNSGCASRNESWRVYSNQHSSGQRVRSNAFYSSSVSCC